MWNVLINVFSLSLSFFLDMNVFYYVILIRNGPQVYATQLMSTHDPMVRGSLDFPNMIKLNNITSKFEVSLELYEMVSEDIQLKKLFGGEVTFWKKK